MGQGQSDDIADLVVKLRADVQELTASMEAARGVVQEKTEKMKDHFHELKKEIAEVFGAEKIKEFFLEGLKEFAEFDKQLDTTQLNLKRFGQATEDSKEQMADWADEIQATTLFTKTEAVTTLNKLVTMTHSLTDSLKLSKLAMDISAASGIGLEQVTLALGNAFEGNTQGLGRFTRNFPELKKVLAEGGDAIGYLASQTEGMAEKIGQAGLAGQLFHLKMAWHEVAEDFAKDNKGAISESVEGFKTLAHWVSAVLSFIMRLAESSGVYWGSVAASAIALKDLLTGHVASFKEQMKSIQEGVKQQLGEIWTWTEEKSKKFGEDMTKGALHAKKSMVEASTEIVRSVQDLFGQAMQKHTETFAQALAAYAQGEVKLVKGVKETEAEFKKRVENMKLLHKDAADYIENTAAKLGKAIAKTSQAAASEMTKAYKDGTLTVGKAFDILGKAIFKSLVMATGEALVQSGVADISTAIADQLNPLLAAAAPGFYASGFAKTAAGGGIMGVAEAALADGGYVTKPTIALLGEAGVEKVTPLSGGHPLDDGGGLTVKDGVHLHYHGVKDAKDAMSSGRAARAGHDLITELDAQRRRQGVRSKRGGRS